MTRLWFIAPIFVDSLSPVILATDNLTPFSSYSRHLSICAHNEVYKQRGEKSKKIKEGERRGGKGERENDTDNSNKQEKDNTKILNTLYYRYI